MKVTNVRTEEFDRDGWHYICKVTTYEDGSEIWATTRKYKIEPRRL